MCVCVWLHKDDILVIDMWKFLIKIPNFSCLMLLYSCADLSKHKCLLIKMGAKNTKDKLVHEKDVLDLVKHTKFDLEKVSQTLSYVNLFHRQRLTAGLHILLDVLPA